MKLLFFTYDFPYPTNSGGKARAYNLLKHAGRGIDITFFSFTRDDFKEEYCKEMEKIGINKIKLFKRRKLRDIRNLSSLLNTKSSVFNRLYFSKEILNELKETIIREKIDAVHLESFYTSFYINQELKNTGAKLICGEENIEYRIYEDYVEHAAHWILKPVYSFESKKIKREEEDMWENSDACLAVVKTEADFIEKVSGKKCYVVENGIDLDEFLYKPKSDKVGKNILFVGNFSYFPNVDAINYFYNDVFKKLEDKDINLTIIGKHSGKLPFSSDKRVTTFEFVHDIKEYYYNADVFVSPVRFGGGTNFKVIEAMACGLPVIADPSRVESLGVEDKKHLFMAENAEIYRKLISDLFTDTHMRTSITRNARLFIEENYSWKVIGEKLNKIWHNIAHHE